MTDKVEIAKTPESAKAQIIGLTSARESISKTFDETIASVKKEDNGKELVASATADKKARLADIDSRIKELKAVKGETLEQKREAAKKEFLHSLEENHTHD